MKRRVFPNFCSALFSWHSVKQKGIDSAGLKTFYRETTWPTQRGTRMFISAASTSRVHSVHPFASLCFARQQRWSRKGIPGTVKPRTIKYPSEGNQLGMLFDTRDSASLFGFHVLQTGTAPWIASNLAVITTIRLATVAENETSGGSEINVAPLNKVLSSNKKAPAHVMSFKHFTRLHNCNGILKNLSPCQANKF